MGIYNVTLGSLNNSTAGYADGYKDYSCTLNTSLTVSQPTAISISTVVLPNSWTDQAGYLGQRQESQTHPPSLHG